MRQLRWPAAAIAAVLMAATASAVGTAGATRDTAAGAPGQTASQVLTRQTVLARHAPPPPAPVVPGAVRTVYSSIWSGHTVPDGLYGGHKITGVTSQWTQPSVPADSRYHCTKTSCIGPTASAWTGFDGRGPGLIQAGCDSLATAKPTYFCWWEDYPQRTHVVPVPVKPGQSVYVDIHYLGHQKTRFFIRNVTTGAKWKRTEPTPDVGLADAIFMVERLMSNSHTGYYLPDFGSVDFFANSLYQGSTVHVLTRGQNFPWVMVDGCSSRDKTLATPGNIVHIDQFTVSWKASRPFSDKPCK